MTQNSNFTPANYFQNLINNETLVQFYKHGEDAFDVGQVLAFNTDYLVYSCYDTCGAFDGLRLIKLDSLDKLKTNTLYLKKYVQRFDVSKLRQQALELLQHFSSPSWEDWLQTAKLQQLPIMIADGTSQTYEGIVLNLTSQAILIKEISSQSENGNGELYLPQKNLSQIAIGEGWLQTISAALNK